MKNVKIEDVKKALNKNTNEIIVLAMYGLEAQRDYAKAKGYKALYKKYDEEWDKLFDLLDSVGHFDDCKKC